MSLPMEKVKEKDSDVDDPQAKKRALNPVSGPHSVLSKLIAETPSCWYNPQEYFVAWQGVLSIVYSGIPPAIVELKQRIHHHFPGLIHENPGSKWSKTGLACLRDGKRLSLQQLQLLRTICREESEELRTWAMPVLVNSLTVAVYDKCCLETLLARVDAELAREVDPRGVSPEEAETVRGTTEAFRKGDLETYWYDVSRDGKRTSHYRCSRPGVTLVHFLSRLPKHHKRFVERVEEALPGMYDWFAEESLHITIRALT